MALIKNKPLFIYLAIIQLAAILVIIIFHKPIREINPEGIMLTYGLFGLILAGINTLLVRKFVS